MDIAAVRKLFNESIKGKELTGISTDPKRKRIVLQFEDGNTLQFSLCGYPGPDSEWAEAMEASINGMLIVQL